MKIVTMPLPLDQDCLIYADLDIVAFAPHVAAADRPAAFDKARALWWGGCDIREHIRMLDKVDGPSTVSLQPDAAPMTLV